MSTEITKKIETPPQALQRLLKANEKALVAAMPKHLRPERLMRLAVTALIQTPAIQNCSMVSICNSVMLAAQLGLEINNGLGHGWLIPYKKNKPNGGYEYVCTFQAGYRGLIDLSLRSGLVHDVNAHVVCDKDEFTVEYGDNAKCIHKPAIREDQGDWLGAYVHIRYREGPSSALYMSRRDIEKVRDQSAQGLDKDSSPWNRHTEEMWKKTPTKRHLKYVKLSPELAWAVGVDDQAEAEVPQDSVLEAEFQDMALEAQDNLKGSVEKQAEVRDEKIKQLKAKPKDTIIPPWSNLEEREQAFFKIRAGMMQMSPNGAAEYERISKKHGHEDPWALTDQQAVAAYREMEQSLQLAEAVSK